jgi:hypothetical protein
MTGILWLAPITSIAVPARYGNTQRQHITLAYGVESEQYADIIGLPSSVGIEAECWDEEVQAVSVVLQNWLPCHNKYPHIAISWVDGSTPVKANVMLESKHQSAPLEWAMLPCMIEFIEWQPCIIRSSWRDRPLRQCLHVWKTGELKGQRCSEMTRREPPYCTKHRPKHS